MSVESSLRKVKVNENRVELLTESESVSSKVIESQALLIWTERESDEGELLVKAEFAHFEGKGGSVSSGESESWKS